MKRLFSRVLTFGRMRRRASVRPSRSGGQRGWFLTRRGSVAWIALFVLTAAATFGSVATWSNPFSFSPGEVEPPYATTVVRRGPLEVSLIESGHLESANNTVIRHQVEYGGGLTILKIVDEGTWVTKDQVLVELDTSRFIKNAQQQQIWTFMHDAGLKTAETRYTIQKMQNESMVAAGEHQLRMAKLDLSKYVEADYPQKRTNILNEIRLATERLETAKLGIEYDEKMIRKGFVTTDEMKADKLTVSKAQLALDIAREKLHVLDEYTHKRDLAQREANAIRFERELDRIKLRADAALNQCQLQVLYYRRWSTYFRTHYNNAMKQIEACTIRAPHEGVVVYANNGASSNASESVIYEGAKVWESQPIIQLPDITNMQVRARIHESKVLLVHEGQPVTIRVDALPDETFTGVVDKMALGPLTPSWSKANLKEYATTIKVIDTPEHLALLKPGMTAEVVIHVEPLESVLQIPVQSCVDRAGRHFAWVVDDGYNVQRRELKVRTSNSDAIEILEGVTEGEAIVLNPRTDLPDEVAELTQEMQAAEEAAAAAAASTMSTTVEWPEDMFDDALPPADPAAASPEAPATVIPPPMPTGRLPEAETKASK